MRRPQRPGMRPDGIGRSGSLIASTSRSYQSLAAWLVAHTSGPASATPVRIAGHRPPTGTPDETTPQPNAHIGANQLNDPRLQGEGFKRGRFEIDRRPRPPELLLVMVPETTGKRCFGARTGQALKAQRATAAAVSSHDATSPILRFA